MKFNKIFLAAMAISSVVFSSCEVEDIYESPFDSKIYIDKAQKKTDILVKPTSPNMTVSLEMASAKKLTQDATITYMVDESYVGVFNELYKEKAALLRPNFYNIPELTSLMTANSVRSTAIDINFSNLADLDRDSVYVLPVLVQKVEGAELLNSRKSHYYVFRGAALINVVANVAENFLTVDWRNPEVVANLSTFTIEGLLRMHHTEKMINTFLGIEEYFLLRFGDDRFPANQLQIVTESGNIPGADPAKTIPLNKWVHMAVTYSNGVFKMYRDGVNIMEQRKSISPITLSRDGFHLGKSYDGNRDWPGEFSEVRIWNVERSKDQIASSFYEVDPASDGLVSYWKFDEGASRTVKDHTINGNNATADGELTWVPVELPEN